MLGLWVVWYSDIMRFLTYYVHVVKCHPDTKFKLNPNQTVSNKVPWLKGTLCDGYAEGLESHYVAVFDMYDIPGCFTA